MTEEIFKNFEKMCRESNINLLRERQILTNEELFKFYKNVMNSKSETNKIIKNIVKEPIELSDKEQIILDVLKPYTVGRTNQDLKITTNFSIRYIQQLTKQLSEKNLIENISDSNTSFWRVKK